MALIRDFKVGALLVLMGASVAPAQSTGILTGRVTGPDSNPLSRARISVVGTSLAAVAEANGSFAVADVPRGAQTLDVRMLGYEPLRLPVDVRAGETLFVRARLSALDAVDLPSVEVVAVFRGPLRGFEERRTHGPGTFLTEDQILRMQPRQVTDVLRRVPGIQIRPVAGFYGENLAVMHRGGRCPVLFYVNGSPLPIADVPINNYVAAHELVGIEIYSPSELPAQFNSSAQNAKCGLIGLWTRSGNDPRHAR